jgi:hypothetical protein
MTWTYTNDPSNVPIDEVRLLTGDTDTLDQLLSDEEVQYFIDAFGAGIRAAIPAVQAIMSKCAGLVNEKTGEVQVDWSDKLDNYRQLLKQLTVQLKTKSVPMPFAGGTSCADIINRQADTDRPEDTFTVGMQDNNIVNP